MTGTSDECIETAMIIKTRLGYEDHGHMTAYLVLEVPTGGIQAFGGLNIVSEEAVQDFITGVLKTTGISCWEDLAGEHIRVKHAAGPLSNIIGIGHIVQERWYIPEEYMKEKTSW